MTPLALRGSRPSEVIEPADGGVVDYHAAKHRVFLRMYDGFMAYRQIMAG